MNDVDLSGDELFGLVRALGAGGSLAADDTVPEAFREVGSQVEQSAAGKLADAFKQANPS